MSKPSRKVPLEVLHLSMPRTGSASMMTAYNILGLNTYHGFDFMERPHDQILWEKAIDAKWYGKGKPFEKEDFDAFLGEFHVLSDLPVVGFTEELLRYYSDAKVVLVDRDIEKWYTSFSTQIIGGIYTWVVWILIHIIDPYFATARPATVMKKLEATMFNSHDQKTFQANACETYKKHYSYVRSVVPNDRLLEYELGSGWEPLCKFLGMEVPETEFPFKNEGKEFKIWADKAKMRILKDGLVIMAKTLIPIGVLILAWMFVFA